MRTLPYNLLTEKNKAQNAPIDLIMIEVSKAYSSVVQSGSTKSGIFIYSALKDLFASEAIYPDDYGDGWKWVISFESGDNVGARRIISLYNIASGLISFTTPLDHLPAVYPDTVRISKCLFLAARNKPVTFYLTDNSEDYPGQAVTYLPFPVSIEPLGTTISGEILNMNIALSNVNKLIGNAVQEMNGLRGNRVTHLRVFDGYLDQGKDYCLRDEMYIDRVDITAEAVAFTLEGRFNILGIQIPFNTYNRDFCRWIYQRPECGWIAGTGIDSTYPLASAASCDHTLNGANGCVAHKNTRRFGGFPAIPSRGSQG